ncbi:MAG TPA: matrixin family metalloprotease [Gemmataceae bacterium]|nr:matrixin family metalloprotease [Gemmataceae bacterium]
MRWDAPEFTIPSNPGEMNRMDLLTVLQHELGHILGYDHTDAGLMDATLGTGIRETPTAVIDQFFAGV